MPSLCTNLNQKFNRRFRLNLNSVKIFLPTLYNFKMYVIRVLEKNILSVYEGEEFVHIPYIYIYIYFVINVVNEPYAHTQTHTYIYKIVNRKKTV